MIALLLCAYLLIGCTLCLARIDEISRDAIENDPAVTILKWAATWPLWVRK